MFVVNLNKSNQTFVLMITTQYILHRIFLSNNKIKKTKNYKTYEMQE